jgi:hypothetical protein
VLGTQDAAVAHQPDGAARRECTSAEAEEVQIVTRLVVLDQKAVAVAHVAGEAKAEGTAAHALEAPGADARVVEEELRVAVAVLAGDAYRGSPVAGFRSRDLAVGHSASFDATTRAVTAIVVHEPRGHRGPPVGSVAPTQQTEV